MTVANISRAKAARPRRGHGIAALSPTCISLALKDVRCRTLSGDSGAGAAGKGDDRVAKKARRQHEVGLSEWGSRVQWLLKFMGYYGKESKIIRSSGILYLNARAVASNPDFLRQFELEESWESEFYVNCLHLWMILVRIRKEGPEMKQLSQEVFDNFWQDLQKGMYHNLGVQSLALNTRTRELQNVFYGSAVSYDFALGTSDAVLGAALYRNIFGLESRAVHINKMTAYVRKQLQMLDVRNPPGVICCQAYASCPTAPLSCPAGSTPHQPTARVHAVARCFSAPLCDTHVSMFLANT